MQFVLSLLKPEYFEYIPARYGESRETLADITKAQTMLNWNPKILLEEWISNYKKEINL